MLVWAHHEWSFRIYLQRARVRSPSGVTNQVTIWSTTSGKNDEDIRTLFLDDRRVLMRLTPQNGRGSHLVAVDLLAGRPDTVYTGDYVDELELSPDKRQVLYRTSRGLYTADVSDWKPKQVIAGSYAAAVWLGDGKLLGIVRPAPNNPRGTQVIAYSLESQTKWLLTELQGTAVPVLAWGR